MANSTRKPVTSNVPVNAGEVKGFQRRCHKAKRQAVAVALRQGRWGDARHITAKSEAKDNYGPRDGKRWVTADEGEFFRKIQRK